MNKRFTRTTRRLAAVALLLSLGGAAATYLRLTSPAGAAGAPAGAAPANPVPANGATGPALTLNKGDHIALIGNALPDRMQHEGSLETFLHARFPDDDLVVRNLAVSGDEVGAVSPVRSFMRLFRYVFDDSAVEFAESEHPSSGGKHHA